MTLRRTGSWARQSELRRTPFTATPALRRAPLPRTRPSRPSVSREEREARRLVRERSMGTCEGCGRAPATDYAHRVARSQGGIWCPSNALHLCNGLSGGPGDIGCHPWSHSSVTEARSVGWILRRGSDPLTVPALLHGRGLVLLTADGGFLPAPTERSA